MNWIGAGMESIKVIWSSNHTCAHDSFEQPNLIIRFRDMFGLCLDVLGPSYLARIPRMQLAP